MIGQLRCEHLEGEVGKFTTCKVYDQRYMNMPIKMAAPDGFTIDAYCTHGSFEEENTLRDLIRAGKCSYTEE